MTQDTPTPNGHVDTSAIMRCYALLGIGVLCSPCSVVLVSGLASLAAICGTIWAYRIRKKPDETGLHRNHGTWLIRTFWIASAYGVLAIILSAAVVSGNADTTALQDMQQAIDAGHSGVDVQGYLEQYAQDNKMLMSVSSLLLLGPVMVFALLRFFIGYRQAEKGLPVANLKTWLIR